jgi:predicted lactoylglutathione lyase
MSRFYKSALLISLILLLLSGQTICQKIPFNNLSLDHITIAVKDLSSTTKFFSDLGFTIKPGTMHKNSIENAHIKFGNDTSIEILTASKKRDEMSAWYVDHINKNPNGSVVFAALRTDSSIVLNSISKTLLMNNYLFKDDNLGYSQIISFHNSYSLHPIFFIHYKSPQKEIIEYTNHQNGAKRITDVEVCIANINDVNPLFDTTNFLVNSKLRFIGSEECERVHSVEVVVENLKQLKKYFRKVDRKKFINRIDYSNDIISMKTNFNLVINFRESSEGKNEQKKKH